MCVCVCVCVCVGVLSPPSPLPPLWGQASVSIHGLGSLKRRPHQRVPELWLTAGGSTRGGRQFSLRRTRDRGGSRVLRAWGSVGAGALGAGRPPLAWPGRPGGHPAGLRGAGPVGPQGWGSARPPPSPGFSLRGGGRGSAFLAPRMPCSACQGRPRFPSAAQLAHLKVKRASLVAQRLKHLPAMQKTWLSIHLLMDI